MGEKTPYIFDVWGIGLSGHEILFSGTMKNFPMITRGFQKYKTF